MERNLGISGRLEQAGDALGVLSRLAGRLPELAERAERLSQDIDAGRGLRLHAETVEGIGQEVARYGRSQRIALWVIALAAAGTAVAALLLSVVG
jgi:ubiquinone biosynthesis protein